MVNNSKVFSFFVNLLLGVLIAACIIPFWLLFVSSITSESYLVQHGYSLVPKEFSFAAYEYLWEAKDSIGRAYLMSVIIAGIGVIGNIVLTVLFAGGQSNMEFLLRDDAESADELAVDLPDVRCYEVPKIAYAGQENDRDYSKVGVWRKSRGAEAKYFTASR